MGRNAGKGQARVRSGFVLAPLAALSACAADQAARGPAQIGAQGATSKGIGGEAAICAMTEPTIESLEAMHRCAAKNPRLIDKEVAAAMTKAEAACGGPVYIDSPGDPADQGADPSDYQCEPR